MEREEGKMEGNGFNIFDYVDEMKKSGMPPAQADAVGKALSKMATESAATKHDLEFAKLELKKDIEVVKAELKQDIELIRSELKQDIEIVRKDIELIRSELKQDIELVRSELKQDIELVRSELKQDIEQMRTDTQQAIKTLELRIENRGQKTTIWLGGAIVGSATFIIGAILLMARLGVFT